MYANCMHIQYCILFSLQTVRNIVDFTDILVYVVACQYL